MKKLFIDLSHTSHTDANSGVQRVARSFYSALGQLDLISSVGITWDPYAHCWRELDQVEERTMEIDEIRRSGIKRRPVWPWKNKLIGYLARHGFVHFNQLESAGNTGVIFPEIISPRTLFELNDQSIGKCFPRAAVFHDAIPVKFPELAPRKTVEYFPKYLEALHSLDGVIAVSRSSANDLIDYWKGQGLHDPPPVGVIGLGADFMIDKDAISSEALSESVPRFLYVSTIEGRKNHVALLSACQDLWKKDYLFDLELVGGLNMETGKDAHDLAKRLKSEGYPIILTGRATDEELRVSYSRSDAIIYPSLYEGFGLPIIEALQFGKPVIATPFGSLVEFEAGGGVLLLEDGSPEGISKGIQRVLTDKELLDKLNHEARSRDFRSWHDFATDCMDFMRSLNKVDGKRISGEKRGSPI